MHTSASIPFNRPFIAGKELFYVAQAVTLGNIAGDGPFTQKCAGLLENVFGISRVLMTPSCTAALEMAAILCELGPGDEVIIPSYTFVSTASAVARLGAKPIFVDIRPDTLNIDPALVLSAINSRTRAIFAVHYAGVGCDIQELMGISRKYDLLVVEDAAQGVNSFIDGRALGSIGHLGCYSFHETKNYICGEGGALCINDSRFLERAEIIRDKGTNRQNFFRGMVDKYTWVDIGSSYVPSELSSAFLFGQLELLNSIATQRERIFQRYRVAFEMAERQRLVRLPIIPPNCRSNFHMFYLILPSSTIRDSVIAELRSIGITAVFHYVPLHSSPMGRKLGCDAHLPVTDDVSSRLLRLPMYYDMTDCEQDRVIQGVLSAMAKYVG